MARKRDRDEGRHPVVWLLLGFVCGVTAMLGALLLLLNSAGGEGGDDASEPEVSARIAIPPLQGAPPPGGPVVLIPPPAAVEPATPIQEAVAPPALPTFQPEPQGAPAKPAVQPR